MSLLNKKLDVAIRYIFSLHMYKAKKKKKSMNVLTINLISFFIAMSGRKKDSLKKE